MDIQVRFEDGSTELRPAWSPCIADVFEPNLRHPSEERWYQHLPGERLPLLFCGRSVRPLSDWRGEALVWRITGQDDITKALTGEWQSCRVETADEQIERLSKAADAADGEFGRLKSLILTTAAQHEKEAKRLRRKGKEAGATIEAALSEELFRIWGEFLMGPEASAELLRLAKKTRRKAASR